METFNENEWKEYLSGTSDIVVAITMYSLETEDDRMSENYQTDEYQDVVTAMLKITGQEYQERKLDWRAFDKNERFVYLAQTESEE